MRRISVLVMLTLVVGITSAVAQVLDPAEIADPASRSLQKRYFDQLKQFATDARTLKTPYPFCFSRIIDVSESQQASVDQRSIHFAAYQGRTVLQMTGNYYASYSSHLMDYNHRVREDFQDVVLPLLKLAERRFDGAGGFQAYALEISHHVRGKIIGVSAEGAENVVFIFPRGAAERLVKATTVDEQQAAVLASQVLVDGQPFNMWLTGDPPKGSERPRAVEKTQLTEINTQETRVADADPIEPTVNAKLLGLPEPPSRIVNSAMLGDLAVQYDAAITRMTHELDSQAHFISYVPPSFIAFRNAAYLQLPMTTRLPASLGSSSRYKLAALAFDEHVAQLVRAVVAYFPDANDFDGIDFSTSIDTSAAPSALAVEFILPLRDLRCYATSACSGQQLLNSGAVLINGGRVTLDLEKAEN